jgi:hypothetical protein
VGRPRTSLRSCSRHWRCGGQIAGHLRVSLRSHSRRDQLARRAGAAATIVNRQGSSGNRFSRGAQTQQILASVVHTARLRRLDTRAVHLDLLRTHQPIACPAFRLSQETQPLDYLKSQDGRRSQASCVFGGMFRVDQFSTVRSLQQPLAATFDGDTNRTPSLREKGTGNEVASAAAATRRHVESASSGTQRARE